MRLPIRARLTLAFAALMAVVLTVAGLLPVPAVSFRSAAGRGCGAPLAGPGHRGRAAALRAAHRRHADRDRRSVRSGARHRRPGHRLLPGLQDGPVLTASALAGLRQPRLLHDDRARGERSRAGPAARGAVRRAVRRRRGRVAGGPSRGALRTGPDARRRRPRHGRARGRGGLGRVRASPCAPWTVMRSRAAAISADDLSRTAAGSGSPGRARAAGGDPERHARPSSAPPSTENVGSSPMPVMSCGPRSRT